MKYEVRVHKVKNDNGRFKGVATIVIDNCLVINDFSIIANPDGRLFVSNPRFKCDSTNENGKPIYRDIVYSATKEFRNELDNAILEKYREEK